MSPTQLSTLDMPDITTPTIASLARRLITLVYDGLVLFAVLIFASALTLPFRDQSLHSAYQPLLSLYFLGVTFCFFGWFWTHGGQTLGMRAWRLRLEQKNSSLLTWRSALLRFILSLPLWLFILAVILLGYVPRSNTDTTLATLRSLPTWPFYLVAIVWIIIDNVPNNWRDHLTHTRVIVLPKQP